MTILVTSIEQLLLLTPLLLGIYISYSVLKITDITVDGSFVLGAIIFARLISSDYGYMAAIPLVICGGASCGLFVAIVQRKGAIEPLIAGILVNFMLFSVNLLILGRPNMGLYGITTIYNQAIERFPDAGQLIFTAIFGLITLIFFYFLVSRLKLGLKLRAFGHNPKMLERLGYKPENLRMAGLAISNGLAALSGALTAQVGGYADINMGFGVALTTIASLIIGLCITKILFGDAKFRLSIDIIGIIFGAFLYFICVNLSLTIGINPDYLKLFVGGLIIIFMRVSSLSRGRNHE